MMGEAGLYLFPLQASVEIALAPLGYRFPAGGPERPRIGLRALLPDGLTEGPVAFADENAVIVRGRADAIDEFREIVALLDKPAKRVSLSLRLFVPTDVDGAGLRDIEAGPGESESEEGHGGAVASAVVPSNRLANVRTGLAAPFVVAPAESSPDGYQANAAVDAREFLVLPRVNADSSVSLLILPGDGGEVPWADPTGRAVADESPILLRKDGTAVLGGFPRAGELVAKEGGPVRLAAPGASSDSQALLLITARVVPDGEVQAALPAN
jgi:hypothetical protein